MKTLGILQLNNKVNIGYEMEAGSYVIRADKRVNGKCISLRVNTTTMSVENNGFDGTDLSMILHFITSNKDWLIEVIENNWIEHKSTVGSTMICALNSLTGRVVYIDEAEDGKKCNCTCVKCHKPVIAKHGAHRMHSFSHMAGSSCGATLIDSIKEAVANYFWSIESYELPIPVLRDKDLRKEYHTNPIFYLAKQDTVTVTGIDRHIEYKSTNGFVKVDLVIRVMVGDEAVDIIVETYTKGERDKDRIEKLRALRLPCIGIELDRLASGEINREYVLEYIKMATVTWIYNDDIERLKKNIGLFTQRRNAIAGRAIDCYSYEHKRHCESCPYMIASDVSNVICGYKTALHKYTLADLKTIPWEMTNKALLDIKNSRCPKCGRQLEFKENVKNMTHDKLKDQFIGHRDQMLGGARCAWSLSVPEDAATKEMEELLIEQARIIDTKRIATRYYEDETSHQLRMADIK